MTFKIQKFEQRQGWNAKWEDVEGFKFQFHLVKSRAKGMAKDDPKGSYRVVGDDGYCYYFSDLEKK